MSRKGSLLKQAATGLTALGLLSLVSANAARAGYFQLSATGSGYATTTGTSPVNLPFTVRQQATNGRLLVAGIGTPATGMSNGSASGTLSVTLTITGKWVPNDANDTAPSAVLLEESGGTSFWTQTYMNGPVSGDANDGLGDPCKKSGQTDVPPYHQNTLSGTSATFGPDGSQIRHFFSQAGGSFTFTRTFSASFNCSGYAGSGWVAMGDYNLQIHAQPYAFTRSTGTMDKDNNLICSYTYKSTSGSISDLGSCRWHERITYPGTGNAYIAPAPFSGAFINPTITPNEVMNTSLGAIGTLYDTDSGEYWPFVGPPFSASIPITVQFEYDDLSTGKSNILIPGPDAIDTIVRSITQSKPRYTDPTIWWYHITNQRLEGWVWLGSSGS